jgi:hypothetical protein
MAVVGSGTASQRAQLLVVGSPAGRLLPLQQRLVVLLEPAILLVQLDDSAPPVDHIADGRNRARDQIKRWGERVSRRGAHRIEHQLISLAEHNNTGRDHDQDRHRGALYRSPYLSRDADHLMILPADRDLRQPDRGRTKRVFS